MKLKTLTTQIIILILLFQFPSVSFSQTFKCEFIQEKFEGGSSNNGICSGDPELNLGRKSNDHCWTEPINNGYEDYLDFEVDLNSGVINWIRRFEFSKDYLTKNKSNSEPKQVEQTGKVISHYFFKQRKGLGALTKYTDSYIIIYTQESMYNDIVRTLYIPQNGKSIISRHITNADLLFGKESSWLNIRFGTCGKEP